MLQIIVHHQLPTTILTIQFIENTYYYHKCPTNSNQEKIQQIIQPPHTKLRLYGWKVNSLITITVGVRRAMHEHSIKGFEHLKITHLQENRPLSHLN